MTQIYLISPPKIDLDIFSKLLEKALKTGLVPAFQLRLKDYDLTEVQEISKKLKKICDDNDCLFILNDYADIAFDIGASGVHIGMEDGLISEIRKKAPENFLIGASCYDSKHLVMEAGDQGADYISFGAFFESKTKKSRGKPTVEIVEWCDEIINLPIVAIGGITDKNCDILVKAGVDFISVISYVWENEVGVVKALKSLDLAIKKAS